MPKKPLRSQLNQVRAWVRQGRTDAWIAHQLEVPASELREFRRRHELSADGDDSAELDLRDEIEAEIEAAALEDAADEADEPEPEPDEDADDEAESQDEESGDDEQVAADSGDKAAAPARRRRRGGRGRRRAGADLQATFDHGEHDGFGLWLDPAVADDPVYSEHWASHRAVQVTIEPDRIVIKRTEP